MTVWYGPDRDKSQEVTFTLTVTGAPYMEVEPNAYDFGVVSPGTEVQIPATIFSSGAADLSVMSISADQADTTITGTPGTPFTLTPGVTQPLTLRIDTTGLNGLIQRTVTITSDNAHSEGTQTISITGMVGSGTGDVELVGGAGNQEDPHLYGTSLVYRDDSSGSYQIYLKDVISGAVTQLTTDTSYLYLTPRIYENYVVWAQRPISGDYHDNDIYLMDLQDNENSRFLTNDSLLDSRPRIWGDYVVWQKRMVEEPTIRNDILRHRISIANTIYLTSTPDVNEVYQEIQGNYAVWYDQGDRVFRHTLSTGSTPQIAALDSIEGLTLYGDRVVWIDEYNGDYYDVFVYDGAVTNLSNDQDARDEEEVTIYEDLVIYLADDRRLYKAEIGGSGPEVFVSGTSSKEDVFIYGDIVVWEDYRNGHADIYMKSMNTDDLTIHPNNISFDPTGPAEGQSVTITAQVQNLGEGDLSDVLIRFYEGDPGTGGVQIDSDQTIPLIAAGATQPAQVTWPASLSGDVPIYVLVDPDNLIPENNESNNSANKIVAVTDNDDTGPDVLVESIEEHSGDGDGLLEDNEEIKISWNASDPSGIGTSSCNVDGAPAPVQSGGADNYYIVVGPLSAGPHDFACTIQDNDNSPASSDLTGSFTVYLHAPQVTSVLPLSGATNASVRPMVQATFNESLNPASVTVTNVTLRDPTSVLVPGSVNYDQNTWMVSFYPNVDLQNSATYTATLIAGAGGIRDENNNPLEVPYTWSFTIENDTISPMGVITSPEDSVFVRSTITVLGTAWDVNLDSYQVFYGAGQTPGTWTAITAEIDTAVTSGPLCTWDTTAVADGEYTLRLVVQDKLPATNVVEDTAVVVVDNTPPSPPVVSGDSPTNNTTPTWTWSSGGGGNGVFRYKLDDSGLSTGAVTTSDTFFTPLAPLSKGEHILYIQESDAAGNWSDSSSLAIEIVTLPDELASDFGAKGLWHYDNIWDKLTSWDPENLVRWENRFAADFGSGKGLWLYETSTLWTKISSWDPEDMVAWNDCLVVDFGVNGIWTYCSGVWNKLTTWVPERMVAWGDKLAADFGAGRGLWFYETSGWTKFTSWDPEDTVAWNDCLVADFGVDGIWMYCSGVWTKLTTWDPERMVARGDKLAADFGSRGLWLYSSTGWTKMTSWDPEDMIAWGDNLAADFGSQGLWLYSSTGWTKITNWDPEKMEAMANHFATDFGSSRGLWLYETGWTKISSWDPEDMEAVDLH